MDGVPVHSASNGGSYPGPGHSRYYLHLRVVVEVRSNPDLNPYKEPLSDVLFIRIYHTKEKK